MLQFFDPLHHEVTISGYQAPFDGQFIDSFEVMGQTNLAQRLDNDLRRVELPPPNAITIVACKRVMVIVVAFAKRQNGQDEIVDGCVFRAVGL
jgi:hypothetical protein